MSKLKKVALIAFVLILIGVVGSIFTMNSISKAEAEIEKVRINNETYKQIDISTNNARVEISPAKDQNTTVEFSGSEEYNLHADVQGDTLTVDVEERRGFKLLSFDFSISSPSLKVYLPEKMYDTVKVESDNGRISASNLQSKDISVETNNGRIEFGNIKSSRTMVETDNGRIHLENIEGAISGRTNNGRISLITKDLDRPIDLQSDNGRIEIQTEKEPTNAILDIKTDNGKITVFGDSNWDTVIGNGDYEIKLTTNNGGITIDK
jgi:DUF4097 and DUF4098 domain-containing protein YvlB